jgi:hypothetical protein
METVIFAAIAFAAGTIVQVFASRRDMDRECNHAYLTGHVDGYEKAMWDAGVPE